MRIVNKDMTKESVKVFITNNQIYAKIWTKVHGKWTTETFLKSFDSNIDEELINSTTRYIKRVWNLKDPVVTIIK